MPYIDKDRRELINRALTSVFTLINNYELKTGDINYIFSKIANNIFERSPDYETINDLLGVFEAAKLEFYRRKGIPYEERKIKENGDI